MNKKAFTLVELMIATVLLGLLLTAAFTIFGGSNKGFKAGTWRMTTQKDAQRFLLRFKENVERATHLYSLDMNGERILESKIPITVASAYYNALASSTNTGILFGSRVTPICNQNLELGIKSDINGIWKGLSLECFDKTLSFVYTGDRNTLLSTTPPASIGPTNNTRVTYGNRDGDFITSIKDVDSIGVFVRKATDSVEIGRPEVLITLKLVMLMPDSNGKTTVSEQITARIHDRELDEVTKGSSYPSAKR
ncbi:MAG: prepilin-type N-terminal cleavage/methylation domain-containing protein [Candidatus Riflebacteria bacterium]|nr:prepilin-type N-terminal cleavage/methylation domain-containing protein [Candidatus Riflebacteria bacterium]